MRKTQTLAIYGLMLVSVLFLIGILGIATGNAYAAMTFTGMPFLPFAGLVYGRKMFDWSKVDKIRTIEEKKEKIIGAANHFIKKILKLPVGGGKVTGPDANLLGQIPVVLVMSDTIKTPDRGYELLFEEVDMRQSNSDTFDILDVAGGVTFYQHAPGEEAKLSEIPSSAFTHVKYLRFTGGLNVLDDWLRFNKYYLIDDLFGDTVRRWFNRKATLFYGLLTALGGGINQAFETDDVTTINNACAQILIDLEAAGYSVDENPQFVITCNPKLRGRIFKALAATFVNPNTNNNQVLFNISGVINTTKVVNTSYYVSLPGVKNKRGEWEDFNMRPPQRNELYLGAAHVWTGSYNGAIAEAKQHRRCSLS